jgi:hypothetical protein
MSQPPGYPSQPGDPYGQSGPPPQSPAPGWPPPYPPQPANPAQQPYPAQPGGPQPGGPQPGYGQPAPPPPVDPYASPVSGGGPAPVSPGGYPPGSYPVPGQPTYPQPGYPGQPGYPDQYPTVPLPGGPPGYGPPPAPPRKRRGMLITIVLVVTLLLCGVGGTGAYLLLRNLDGKGQASPADAVSGFLTAVFVDNDVEKATKFVCSQARNKASLTKKINELRDYEQKYREPKFAWAAPTVESQTKTSATLLATVRFSTADERVAEKKLKFVTVKKSGWFVCEIRDAG